MAVASLPLPENPDELRAFAEALRDRYEALEQELYAKTLHIEKLKMQLAVLRRARFGRSSEKLDRQIEQLELALGELEESKAQSAAGQEAAMAHQQDETTPVVPRPQKGVPVRKPLPEHLPRERVEHPTACVCPSCGGTRLPCIGTDERGSRICAVTLQGRCACAAENELPELRDDHPAAVAELADLTWLAGTGLARPCARGEYCDHLPLHRQSGIYARSGVDLERSTLADWVGHMAFLLQPLTEAIGAHVRAGETLHAMIRRCRYSIPAAARPKPAGYGLRYAMNDPGARRCRRLCITSILLTEGPPAPKRCCADATGISMPMPMQDSTASTKQIPGAACR